MHLHCSEICFKATVGTVRIENWSK